jgi:cytoplasmic iron level regulating protein YaaA (DUF328/UPF0246 family)
VLFLLPPSESKRQGGGALTLRQVALTFGRLNPARDTVLAALQELCANPEKAAKQLGLSAKQLGDIGANLEVLDAPTMPAIQRYSGTLYDAILRGAKGDEAELTAGQLALAKQSVLIQSSLFGLISAGDLIPNYRLGAGTSLPSVKLGTIWPTAHEPIFRRLNQGLVVDLRSKAYVALAPIPGEIEHLWVEVVSRESNGQLRALNHFNKQAKGLLIRAVLKHGRPLETNDELAQIAAGIGMELRKDEVGNQLLLITDQVKKADL